MKQRIVPIIVGSALGMALPCGLMVRAQAAPKTSGSVFETASADPNASPDADNNTVDVWQVEKKGVAGSGLVSEIDGNTNVWKIWTGNTESSITQTHFFAGGALAQAQAVSLDYAHATEIAPGKRVGLRLLGAGGTVEVELSFLGGGPGFQRKDAGTDFAVIGKSYDPNHLFNVAFTITGNNSYSAVADGYAWSGTFKTPITGIQVFNDGGGEKSEQMSDNLIVQRPDAGANAAMNGAQGAPMKRPAFMDSKQIDARVAALLKQMTLTEKLGQLSQFSDGNATGPDNVRVDQNELATRGGIGSVPGQTHRNQAVGAARMERR